MNVLDLFSGCGAFSLGLEAAGMKTVAFCEIDPFCRYLLKRRWPDVPIFNDIFKISAKRLAGFKIDVICGGFPCTDISLSKEYAGGLDGSESGKWFRYAELIDEIRPRYAIVENVPALLVRGFDRVLGSLAEIGYDAEWSCISSAAMGAPHIRDRLWIVAYPKSQTFATFEPLFREGADDPFAANADSTGPCGPTARQNLACNVKTKTTEFGDTFTYCGLQWPPLNSYLRMGDGIARPTHSIRIIGNSLSPQIPELIGKAIMKREARNEQSNQDRRHAISV